VVALCQTAQLASVRLQRDTLSSTTEGATSREPAGWAAPCSVYSRLRLQRSQAVSRSHTNTGAVSSLETPVALK
jgi:hypothetical protein